MSYDVKQWLPVDQIQEAYKQKLVTADEAVKIVESEMCIRDSNRKDLGTKLKRISVSVSGKPGLHYDHR